MPQVKPEIETFARIKVFGAGGSGQNAITHMINSKVKGVEFVAVNTDVQDLHNSPAKKKIHIGKNLTKGLGAGMNPEIGRRSAEETKEEVQESMKNSDMIFITGGMGGGTASGSTPILANVAKESGALTLAVVTKPFFFEGRQRMQIAEQAIEELKKEVDAIIVVPNDRLLSNISKETTVENAFAMCDDVLKQAVEGISDLITTPGIINIDFADVRAILKDSGSALMGVGIASGEKRAEDAAKMAINSPLLDVSINGAQGLLFSIAGSDDLTMFEIQEAAKIITESMDPDAKVIFGTVRDESLKKGEIKVTIISSGFPEGTVKKSLFGTKEIPMSEPVEEEVKEAPVKEEKKVDSIGKIFNSLPEKKEKKEREDPVKEEKSKKVVEEKKKTLEEEEDAEWGAVPAFLRRSKIK